MSAHRLNIKIFKTIKNKRNLIRVRKGGFEAVAGYKFLTKNLQNSWSLFTYSNKLFNFRKGMNLVRWNIGTPEIIFVLQLKKIYKYM